VVDDNPTDLKILQKRLGGEGYQRFAASDGEQAFAAVAAEPPDPILLDIMMPKVDGLEVRRRLSWASCATTTRRWGG
jgi:two-component system response regulator MprA